MVDRRSEMRTWQNKLYNLQREAPKPLPIPCALPLSPVPQQYTTAYHGPISRQATEEILTAQPSGAYLIRDSQRSDDAFTLAIRFDDATKNYKLFYDSSTNLHYVGEKKFDSVDLLVADGLIYLYIETRGADILQKLSEVSNYECSPYYKTRYHTVSATPSTRSQLSTQNPQHFLNTNNRRQSSLEECIAAHERTPGAPYPMKPPTRLNGDGQIPPESVVPIEKPARSTSLPHPKPPRGTGCVVPFFPSLKREILVDPSDAAAITPTTTGASTTALLSSASSSTSGDASLNSPQSSACRGSSASRNNTGSSHRLSPMVSSTETTPPHLSLLLPLVHLDIEKQHEFKLHTFRGPHWCDFCTHFIWGLVSQGYKCSDCGFQAHKRCRVNVPNDCLPDMKRLRRVFGVDLTDLVRAENRSIPQVLVKCVSQLENRGGLVTEGVYRVPGNQEVVEDFRIALDKDCETVDLSEKRCPDINTITSLIKSFLRQLPLPIITEEAYPELIALSRDDSLPDDKKHDLVKSCIQRLPPAHYHSLRYLMAHLNRVATNCHSNMMTSENLSIVFAPSLMSSSYTDPMSCLASAKFEQAIVERLIVDYASIFDNLTGSSTIDNGLGTEPSTTSSSMASSTSTSHSRSTTASWSPR